MKNKSIFIKATEHYEFNLQGSKKYFRLYIFGILVYQKESYV